MAVLSIMAVLSEAENATKNAMRHHFGGHPDNCVNDRRPSAIMVWLDGRPNSNALEGCENAIGKGDSCFVNPDVPLIYRCPGIVVGSSFSINTGVEPLPPLRAS